MPTTNSPVRPGRTGRRRLALLLPLLHLLAGCAEYRERHDHVSLQLGDAIETNKVVHVASPWPSGASRARLPYDAERMLVAYDRYRNGGKPEPTGGADTAPTALDAGSGSGSSAGPAPK